MDFEIYLNGEIINTVHASEKFVKHYCAKNGYTYAAVSDHNPKRPIEDRVSELERQRIQADDIAIWLYEDYLSHSASQDDALIELYEMIGGS